MKQLIINADDCNLTQGVTRAILRCHDQGILTSTTILMNLPLESQTVHQLQRRKRLGIGIHLNVTLARPLSSPSKIRSLLKSEGIFKRPLDYLKKPPVQREIVAEYDRQIQHFVKHFSKKPDHLDTHHHLHDFPLFFHALAHVAKKWRVPIRRSRIFLMGDYAKQAKELKTTDYLYGNLEAHFSWQRESLLSVVESLHSGTSEIACHPGYCDRDLRKISSLREARETELKLFSEPKLRKVVTDLGIDLIRFTEV